MDLLEKYGNKSVHLDTTRRNKILRQMECDGTIQTYFHIDPVYCAPEVYDAYSMRIFKYRPNECTGVILVYDHIQKPLPSEIRNLIESTCV